MLSNIMVVILMGGIFDSHSSHHDSEFLTVEPLIHTLIKHPVFDSVQRAKISLRTKCSTANCLACDVVLTKEELERQLCLILEPWDKRGILSVKGYHERTT